MKISRMESIFVCLAAALCLCSAYKRDDDDEPRGKHLSISVSHHHQPKIFGLFSKPPENDPPKHIGLGILSHLGTALHGRRSIDIQVRPLLPFHGIFVHANKYVPKETVGHPLGQKPPPYEPPNKDNWELWEKPQVPHPVKDSKEVNKPKDEGPHWDNIGEDPEDYSPDVPIEDIIQPRLKPRSRPKRFIHSKIYHVPLTFRSNGRVYRVKWRKENELGSSGLSKAL